MRVRDERRFVAALRIWQRKKIREMAQSCGVKTTAKVFGVTEGAIRQMAFYVRRK